MSQRADLGSPAVGPALGGDDFHCQHGDVVARIQLGNQGGDVIDETLGATGGVCLCAIAPGFSVLRQCPVILGQSDQVPAKT
jgi:hypothetical protein